MSTRPRSRSQSLIRHGYRKLVYRRHFLERYDRLAGEIVNPSQPLALEVGHLGPDEFDRVTASNPHLDAGDIEHFRRQNTTCTVIRDGDRLVASAWTTNGDVHIRELQRVVHVPPTERYACRGYVDPEYRGLSLAAHLARAYSAGMGPDGVVWSLIYRWNHISSLLAEQHGARCTGEYWTSWVLGVKVPGERRFPPRPPRVF